MRQAALTLVFCAATGSLIRYSCRPTVEPELPLTNLNAVNALKAQHERLTSVIRHADEGRWWPSDALGHDDAEKVRLQAERIGIALDEIERVIAAMKK